MNDPKVIPLDVMNVTMEAVLKIIEPRRAPYPFCYHADRCIAAGRCAHKDRDGDPHCCAD